jgi:hypothetical protein
MGIMEGAQPDNAATECVVDDDAQPVRRYQARAVDEGTGR